MLAKIKYSDENLDVDYHEDLLDQELADTWYQYIDKLRNPAYKKILSIATNRLGIFEKQMKLYDSGS